MALSLVNNHDINPGDVREIALYCKDREDVLLFPLEKRTRPENPVDSQFSVPWAVAVAIARGRVGIGDFTEEAIRSGDILEISGRIRIEEDADLKKAKGMDPSRIVVTTKQGKTYVESADITAEDSEKTLPFSAYERKFRDCAAYSVKPLSDRRIDEVIACIRQLEKLDDIRQLIQLLN